MKKDRNRDKGPKDKDSVNKKEQSKEDDLQPINTGLVTTDADEWKGIEVNNESDAFDKANKQPIRHISNEEDKEGREEADDELNTHEQNKVTNKNRNIVNKPD